MVIPYLGVRTDRHSFGIVTWKQISKNFNKLNFPYHYLTQNSKIFLINLNEFEFPDYYLTNSNIVIY